MTKNRSVRVPVGQDLPLFAYGLFKPGQLGFFRIRDFAEAVDKQSIATGRLMERDGVPLLVPGEFGRVKGVLVLFRAGGSTRAYERIAEIEPREVYRWEEIEVLTGHGEKTRANALVGRRDHRGSTELEDIEEWDGREDPYFGSALKVVEETLAAGEQFDWDMRPLFRLQMAYSLLWSAIERYASLRYHLGEKAMEKVLQIAGEPAFGETLLEVVSGKREIYSTVDLAKYTLDPGDPRKSIKYYYQVRSNSAHRGKAVTSDFETVRASLRELLAIFQRVKAAAFEASEVKGSQIGA